MAGEDLQDAQRELWLGGKEGSLCEREQARVWALREQWRDEGKTEYGMLTHIASKVRPYGPSSVKGYHHSPPGEDR